MPKNDGVVQEFQFNRDSYEEKASAPLLPEIIVDSYVQANGVEMVVAESVIEQTKVDESITPELPGDPSVNPEPVNQLQKQGLTKGNIDFNKRDYTRFFKKANIPYNQIDRNSLQNEIETEENISRNAVEAEESQMIVYKESIIRRMLNKIFSIFMRKEYGNQ